ncbi:beta-ketothiolase BktB [Oceanobacter mangrovi]|uniref:beta-ketothiolase BktB n=1 Tax=Oceanobacter mangrovi TaxID=2862510 RepID=UPI001C8EFB69|nr:beta-ketothiolase BktB [Oceanobacter mangrovi]
MKDVVVVSGVRSAIGSYGQSLKDTPICDMAAAMVAEAVKRAGLTGDDIDHTVIGNVIHSEPRDMYISRVAAVNGGVREGAPALTVNRLCGSGLQAIITAAQQVQLGLASAVVAGGAESMSRAPYHLPTARFGQRMGDGAMVDPMVAALTCPFNHYHMGVTAENVAEKYGVSREDQDAYAAQGHQRAQSAIENGYFESQILPIELKSRKGVVEFKQDEHVRFNCSVADMEKLRPVFKKDGTVTAGNASGLNDGAAAIVMMEREAAEQRGLNVMARLVDYSVQGVDPKIMGIGPVPAIRDILDRQGLGVNDIDVYEVNEAFAAQALAVARELKLPQERLNPNGSGIALGHPVGATGAIITVKALYELQRIGGRYAMVSLCIGGGQGIAALFERV